MAYLGRELFYIDPAQAANLKRFLWTTIIVAIGCALLQAGLNRSLWLDEGKLATNIITRDYKELLQPLDSNQVAPIGFLLLEKLMTQLFGNRDLVLRVIPFIAYVLALVYMFKSARLISRSILFALLATAILSVNYKLLYYSWEVKQYAVDVFVCLLILYSSLKVITTPTTRRLIGYALIGMASLWFSNISVILLAAFGGYAFWMLCIRQKKWIALVSGLCWLLSFGVYYWLFVAGHPINREGSMLDFWEYGFLPSNPFSLEFYSYLVHIAKDICYFIMEGYVLMLIPAIFMTIGIIKAIKEKFYTLHYLLGAPVLVHLILSGLRIYPMRDRLLLYLIPLAIIIMSYGIAVSLNYCYKKYKGSAFIILSPLIALLFVVFLKKYPFYVEEVRSSIQHISKRIEPSETLYVYGSAIDVFNFYSYNNPDFENRKIVRGTFYKTAPEKYIPEIESIGGTLWILFAHTSSENREFDEKNYIVEQLKANGHEVLEEQQFYESSAVKIQLN